MPALAWNLKRWSAPLKQSSKHRRPKSIVRVILIQLFHKVQAPCVWGRRAPQGCTLENHSEQGPGDRACRTVATARISAASLIAICCARDSRRCVVVSEGDVICASTRARPGRVAGAAAPAALVTQQKTQYLSNVLRVQACTVQRWNRADLEHSSNARQSGRYEGRTANTSCQRQNRTP